MDTSKHPWDMHEGATKFLQRWLEDRMVAFNRSHESAIRRCECYCGCCEVLHPDHDRFCDTCVQGSSHAVVD
jgi:hypothetical protein